MLVRLTDKSQEAETLTGCFPPTKTLRIYNYFKLALGFQKFKNAKLGIGKGNRTITDLRYGEIDIIGPSTLIFAPIKG